MEGTRSLETFLPDFMGINKGQVLELNLIWTNHTACCPCLSGPWKLKTCGVLPPLGGAASRVSVFLCLWPCTCEEGSASLTSSPGPWVKVERAAATRPYILLEPYKRHFGSSSVQQSDLGSSIVLEVPSDAAPHRTDLSGILYEF